MAARQHIQRNGSRKRRRLNSNATASTLSSNHGEIDKLKKELSQTIIAKDAALNELSQIKSDTLNAIESKNKELIQIQEQLQTIYHQNQEHKQKESTLHHKIEIFEAQIQDLQKENFQLRAKNYKKTEKKVSSSSSPSVNGHIDGSIDAMEHIKLKKEIKIKEVTINAQNEEIMRLEQQIQELHNHSVTNSDSLQKATKHIDRLQKQINDKKENQTNLAQSEIDSMRDTCDRKMRLLECSLNDYKERCNKFNILCEENEENKQKYDDLKVKYTKMMQTNVTFEHVQSELNGWKAMIREMCSNLLPNEVDLNNEYDLKLCLNELNEKYIICVKERDHFKNAKHAISQKYEQCNKELLNLKDEYAKECKLKNAMNEKWQNANKELKTLKNECLSYKNILATYNVMSPSKNNQTRQIEKLHKENQKFTQNMATLNKKMSEMEQEKEKMNEMIKKLEIERDELLNGKCESENVKILNFRQNPLKLAMDRSKEQKQRKMMAMECKIKDLENKLKTMTHCAQNDGNNDNGQPNVKYFELENKYNVLIKKLKIKNEEIESINKQLVSSKKLYDRMKSLFGKKAGEYRERIYQMTGYNVCLLGDGKHYRLQHLWMDGPDDEIILQIDKYGQLQLKDTEFMRNLNKALLKKLKVTRSLPVFLSELALSLYKE